MAHRRLPTVMNVKGPDGSYWNGPNRQYPAGIDLNVAKENGQARFVFWRVAFGLTLDETFPIMWERAKNAQLPRAGYLYFRPWLNPEHQAQVIYGKTGAEGELEDWLDCEDHGDFNSVVLGNAIKRCLDEYYRLTGYTRNMTIYTRGIWWNDHLGVRGWEKDYQLAVAGYGTTQPYVPNAWIDAGLKHTFHQDSETYAWPGSQDPTMDRTWFNGTESEWEAYVYQPLSDKEKLDRLWAAHPELHG